MKDITKKYTNGEVTIVWKPTICIHSTLCWNNNTGLPEVFNPKVRPWIKPENAITEKIVEHVKKCPSGALSFYYNDEEQKPVETTTENIVETLPNGPLMVYGNLVVKDSDGNKTHKNKVTAFCRCGASNNKPYCDGSHVKIGFKG
ncbi:(4Fe-4S)-binding protein [Pedobacter punctiformis]|uniref:(4Fe-4S)-binding protein n=1 Tax=Pedobacter punctiformis TaxID=3004097 RepID=A0ABT4L3B3_9SPHI|nr:(4Fe-4S)-binding protein [Pedobacter sp. HCMS5-2]MCZ4242407.1 (4Fe-4S)-binding protein [Pedobacter sp. HCMS5-2]